jgi:hypothetical protein
MKQSNLIGLALALGIVSGALISPLFAQQEAAASPQATCFVGENSSAACSGNWIYFSGNTSGLDSGAWVIRVNGETGEIAYKDGKRLVRLEQRE